jgi:hypothetical protein
MKSHSQIMNRWMMDPTDALEQGKSQYLVAITVEPKAMSISNLEMKSETS